MVREALFLQAFPFARHAAQVRSATYGRILRAVGLDREDLEQDATLALWRAVSRFDPARASLRTYAEHVVAKTATSACRRATAKKRTVSDDALLEEPLSVLVRIDLRIDIERALRPLKKKDRMVAWLLANYTPSEVARTLGISRQAVYRIMERIPTALCVAGFREFD